MVIHFSEATFRRKLLAWYRDERRDLPWRRTRDPYRIWLSEVMLQQTQVETVKPYYRRFLKAFPDIRSFSRAHPDRVMKLWEGLGYYARIRNFHEAAKQVARIHGGRVPDNAEMFANLPGVGPYTAAAVMSIAFGRPMPVIDGNVVRVFSRLLDIDRTLSPKDPLLLQAASTLMGDPASEGFRAGDYNQAVMELGARVCTPKSPNCPNCALRTECLARARGTVAKRPVAHSKKARPHRRLAAALIERQLGGTRLGRTRRQFLICRRNAGGLLGGLWEFPTGPANTKPALRQYLKRQFGLDVRVGDELPEVRHAYSHFSVTLTGYACRWTAGAPESAEHTALRWADARELNRVAMPEVNRKLLREISLSPRPALCRNSAPAQSRRRTPHAGSCRPARLQTLREPDSV